MNYRILLVEDAPGLLKLIKKNLVNENFGILEAENGEKALSLFYRENPDLVILDLMLPDMSGLEICRTIRKDDEYDNIPIIIISGKSSDEDKIEGLSTGADDYIAKPFNMKELVIRVRNALRKIHPPVKEDSILKEKDLTINLRAETVQLKGKYVRLTRKEFNLLSALISKRGEVVSRDYLLNKFWGYKYGDGTMTRTLDTHITRLRRKMGSLSRRLKTVKNEGYMYLPDTDDTNKTKDALKKSEKRLQAILSSIGEGVIITDSKGFITYINTFAQNLTGYSEEDSIGKKLEKVFSIVGEKNKKEIYITGRIVKEGAIVELDDNTLMVSEEGKKIPVSGRGAPVRDDDGNIVGVVVVFSDLRAQKLTEYALRESEEELRSILNQSLMGIIIIQDDVVKYANEKAAGMSGKTQKELISQGPKGFMNSIHPEDLAFISEQMSKKKDKIEEGVKDFYEIRLVDKKGNIRWVEINSKGILCGGRSAEMITSVDITARKKAGEEKDQLYHKLIQSEKMAAVGTLAGGVAHEFNNLMTVISGQAQIGKRNKPSERLRRCFDMISDTSDRAAILVDNLRMFTEQGGKERHFCDINEILESILLLIENQLKIRNVSVARDFGDIPEIKANDGDLRQVFMNLIMNSKDALKRTGGKITIKTEYEKDGIIVKFSDNGPGIKKENLKRVFEPFFTTKGDSKDDEELGSGLGLSVCYGIVNNHGGNIEADNKKNGGAVLTVTLPVESGSRPFAKRPGSKKEKATPGGSSTGKVLIIDDEKEICSFLEEYLVEKKMSVKCLHSGSEVNELIRKEVFDIVFLDLFIPGIPGEELLPVIRKKLPEVRIAIMTGKLLNDAAIREFSINGADTIIRKPFSFDEVERFLKKFSFI